jgi:D-serine deaminase-like pyridoxal phosphate-dependent protein
VTGKPIEVCAHPDSGALGAAILAGTSLGIYNSPEQTASRLVRIVRRFDPSPGRTAEYSERLRAYTAAVPKMMEISTASRCKREPRGRVEVITPALVVDLDVFEANVAAAEQMLPASGKMLRPHFKTHRTCALAMRQLGPRAPGFTCATVDEAEALVQAGAWDILLANEVVTASKIERLAVLAKHARVIVAVDDREPMLALAREARRQGTIAEVVIDIDIGLHRCGVRTLTAARDLAGAAAAEPGLRFAGIMGYEGRLRADVTDRAGRIAKAEIEQSGLKVEMVSAGGTSTLCEALQDPHITEIQAGTYALMEPDLDPLGLPFRGAVRVLGSVISRNGAQVVVDVGRRTVGCDSGLPIALVPGATTIRVNDEHTVLTWPGELPPLGTQVSLRPSQNRTTFNLHEVVWLARNGQVAESTPISAC